METKDFVAVEKKRKKEIVICTVYISSHLRGPAPAGLGPPFWPEKDPIPPLYLLVPTDWSSPMVLISPLSTYILLQMKEEKEKKRRESKD